MGKIYDKYGKFIGYSNATGLPSGQHRRIENLKKPSNTLEPNASKGLGDTIEKITKATGIKSIVERASKAVGKDCGCGKRKEKLNNIFPYKNK